MDSPDPLAEANLKIKWADKRIKKIDVLAHNYIHNGCFRVDIEHDAEAGKKHAKLRLVGDIPDDLIDETHAALGFLRGSLDSIAWAVANRSGPPKHPKTVAFPVGESQQAFESAGTQGKIEQVGADWAAFVATLKPYRGGNDLLYDLHTFNNADKHQTLTRIGQNSDLSSFRAQWQGEVSFNVAMFGFALDDGDILVTVNESDPDPMLKLKMGIAFCEVGPDKIRGKLVVATLKQFSSLCAGIVKAARSLF